MWFLSFFLLSPSCITGGRTLPTRPTDLQMQLHQGVPEKYKSRCSATYHQLGHRCLTLLLPCCLWQPLMQTPQSHFKDIKKITLFTMLQTERSRRHTKAQARVWTTTHSPLNPQINKLLGVVFQARIWENNTMKGKHSRTASGSAAKQIWTRKLPLFGSLWNFGFFWSLPSPARGLQGNKFTEEILNKSFKSPLLSDLQGNCNTQTVFKAALCKRKQRPVKTEWVHSGVLQGFHHHCLLYLYQLYFIPESLWFCLWGKWNCTICKPKGLCFIWYWWTKEKKDLKGTADTKQLASIEHKVYFTVSFSIPYFSIRASTFRYGLNIFSLRLAWYPTRWCPSANMEQHVLHKQECRLRR